MNKEIFGIRMELAGLSLLLVGGIWQFLFMDFFEELRFEWQYTNQLEVNVALIDLIRDVGFIDHSSSRANDQLNRLQLEAANAYSDAIKRDSERRSTLRDGQASWMSIVYSALIILGALLILAGKYYIYLSRAEELEAHNKQINQGQG